LQPFPLEYFIYPTDAQHHVNFNVSFNIFRAIWIVHQLDK